MAKIRSRGLIYEYKCRASGPAVYGEKCFKILYSEDFIEKLVHCVKNLGKEMPWGERCFKRPWLGTCGADVHPKKWLDRGTPGWDILLPDLSAWPARSPCGNEQAATARLHGASVQYHHCVRVSSKYGVDQKDLSNLGQAQRREGLFLYWISPGDRWTIKGRMRSREIYKLACL